MLEEQKIKYWPSLYTFSKCSLTWAKLHYTEVYGEQSVHF